MFGRGYGGGFIDRACDGILRGHGAFGPMGMIVLLVLALVIIYILYKKKNTSNTADNDILEILKRKYVEGEITEEEFIQKRDVLTNKKHL